MLFQSIFSEIKYSASLDRHGEAETDPNAIPERVGTVRMKSGTLEMSNVSVVTEMVDMITVTRAYQANQRVIKAHDTIMGKAIETLGRVSV